MRLRFLLTVLMVLQGTVFLHAQPNSIIYKNHQLWVGGTELDQSMQHPVLDSIFRGKSRQGVIISRLDLIKEETDHARERAFIYHPFGISYYQQIRIPEKFRLSVRLAYSADDLSWQKDTTQIFRGALRIGNNPISRTVTVEQLLTDPAFKLIRKGETRSRKALRQFALVSYGDALLRLILNSVNLTIDIIELSN